MARLTTVARLAVDRVAAADYASVTTLQGSQYTTVAASDDIAVAVDEAQYADGPCLRAMRTGEPVTVPDTTATMQWPGFHEVAPGLGLESSVSIPLYTGRGTPIAVLNVDSRDRSAMEPLIVEVAALYATRRELSPGADGPPVSDPGAAELLTGYAQALAVRATIQLAIHVVAGRTGSTPDDAYARLCARAAETGTSLTVVADAVLRESL
ncbi:GAF domain-containing protein [Actinoplanes sp. NPDC023801]|uniref:GAF domain-containing protein n=1 Tax=Actinoplanes sp. NPDC023801 TaxID=3154595 RepID=UPI0033F2F214